MQNLVKRAMVITQRSKEHAKAYDTPVAVIVNGTCGGCVILSGFIALIIILMSAIAGLGSFSDAQVPIVIMLAVFMVWGICLRVIEVYLNYVDTQE